MLINKIKEEIIKYIRESNFSNPNELKFSQKIEREDINCVNYDSGLESDSDITISDIIVDWNLTLSVRKYGIFSFWIDITNLDGYFKLGEYDELTQEYYFSEEKKLNQIDWTYKLNFDDYKFNDTLSIQKIEFDVNNKICTVIF